ncbi:hypothetical protein B0H10DRAFT_1823910, partial [Mycena sp. CBHHK59/15]
WPAAFHAAFHVQVWCTYRAGFEPIRHLPTSGTSRKRWSVLGGMKGWTSDVGWGCMLRTAQSLLAMSLGRLLSWFFDAPAAPFGVPRMALACESAGKDVGMWFGPSAAAGAVRCVLA